MKDKRIEKVKNKMKRNVQMSDVTIESIHTRQTPGRLLCRTSESGVCYINCTTNPPPIRQDTEFSCLSTLARHCGYTDYQEPSIQQILFPLIFKTKLAVPPKVNFLGMTEERRQIPVKSVQNAGGLTKIGRKVTQLKGCLVLTGNTATSYARQFVNRYHSVVSCALNTENLISNNCLTLNE